MPDYDDDLFFPLQDDELICDDCRLVYHEHFPSCPNCELFGAPE